MKCPRPKVSEAKQREVQKISQLQLVSHYTMNPIFIKTICCILFLTNLTRSKVVKTLDGQNELNGLGEKVSELEETMSKLADKDNELEKKLYKKSKKVSELEKTISKLADKDSELEKIVFKLEKKVSNFTKEENTSLGWKVLDEKKKKYVCFCWTVRYKFFPPQK